MKRNFVSGVTYHAIILEQESASFTFGVYFTLSAAVARLEAERRKFDPNCKDECWLYVETVRDGEVVARRDVSTNSIAEANVSC